MEVWLVFSFTCVVVYAGLLCLWDMFMDYQYNQIMLKEKWDRFYEWKREETTITYDELSKMYDGMFEREEP